MSDTDPQIPSPRPDEEPPPAAGERIAKRLARAGLCSRRDAEILVRDGRVAVNGAVLTTPAFLVEPGDIVMVDGKPLPEPEGARLWRYHKPAGLVTTARDEKGRQTVFEALPAGLPRVVSVGRLDLTTEGLLLLTNDGEVARHLELPSTGWIRRYRVRVHGTVDEARLKDLARGPTIDGVRYGPVEAALDRQQGSNAWLTVALKEGKNREIRKVMESLGLSVTRLIRVSYGPFQLGKLERGEVEEVPRRVLKDQLRDFFNAHGGESISGSAERAAARLKQSAQAPKAGPESPKAGPKEGAKPARRAVPKPARKYEPDPGPRAAEGARGGRKAHGAARTASGPREAVEAPGKGPRKPGGAGPRQRQDREPAGEMEERRPGRPAGTLRAKGAAPRPARESGPGRDRPPASGKVEGGKRGGGKPGGGGRGAGGPGSGGRNADRRR
jgi:23S rRNA pseudouridine2605 synthase